MFGSKYAIEHPNKVAAYVGVGQMGRVGVIFMLTRMLFLLPIKDDTTAMIAAFENIRQMQH